MPSIIGESLIILFAGYSHRLADNPDCALESREKATHQVGVKSQFRFLGLRWRRLRQWWAVVATDERDRPTLKNWAQMLALVMRRALSQPRSAEARKQVRRDYAICLRCPFHERHLHVCAGCGCSMPLKLAAGGACWAKERDPNSLFGFGGATSFSPASSDHSS